MRRTFIHKIIFSLALLLFFSACNDQSSSADNSQPSPSSEPEASEPLNQLIEKVSDTSDETIKEFQKLKQLQYQIISLDADKSDNQLQEELNKLGVEGWDCFSVVNKPETDQLQMFCKRRTDTPLRYLPQYFSR